MSEEKMTFSKYVIVFRLWAEEYEKNIKEYGFSVAFNHVVYKSIKEFHEDVEAQLQDYWDKNVLVKDMNFEDAVAVLCGKKNIYDIKYLENSLNKQ